MSATPFSFRLECIKSPVGDMLVVADEQERLRALGWVDLEARLQRTLAVLYGDVKLQTQPVAPAITEALLGYLEGKLDAIDSISVETGGTAFQRSVWQGLRSIPVGTTMSYGDFAARIGRPKAVRAVGHANGSNPICIVVPCHRLIGADGSLTGYGGGLPRKRWLLNHEAAAQGRLI
ncbi:methylated-DNA--[protein]-cysteine S-methyltransferase [Peristeroidobacter soli]|uniref:methylated-DNA--[protein]-cysteine S-methyltransferase n=1 Tax=Peristeroidobacter soli TaxID=2497877 RepID=UPI00101C1039|nr:methylated-DNA--[protein]-cysteine S-methyltransferase [Peristeroidobacter soli]